MPINSFEDIITWQKSKDLCIVTYKTFKNCKDNAFKNQIQRAAVSIMNNIAEGYERNGNKEFRNFLYIAKGSCAEVRSMSSLAYSLTYISEKEHKFLYTSSLEISKLLSGFIKKL